MCFEAFGQLAHFSASAFLIASSTRVGVAGIVVTSTPVACRIALMIAGAVGLESLANLVPDKQSGYGTLQVFAEELCEMLGATVTLWGGYELLERYGMALKFGERDR